jgi:peptide/nickel transport system ATP-binding protein
MTNQKMADNTPLLEVSNLRVAFPTRTGMAEAVRGVSFTLGREKLGIVGESGSGKSVTSYAVMRILDRAGRIAEGSVQFAGIDVRTAASISSARRLASAAPALLWTR